VLGYAVLSLTAVRMIPVAISMVRSGLDRTSVGFLAWFGPRGIASVVSVPLAVAELGMKEPMAEVVAAVALTVLPSVVLHGISAGRAGRSYLRRGAVGVPASAEPRARRSGMGARHRRSHG
jgi:sodium/hydrogen antiporter